MEGVKGIFDSKTIWGGLIALGAGIAGIWGYSVSPADQAHLVDLITGASSVVGSVLAIWGRVVASKQVTITGSK